jgi:hypothetical protein
MNHRCHHEQDQQNEHVLAWMSDRYERMGLTGARSYNAPATRRFKPVTVDGVKYRSQSDAARAIGCSCAALSVAMHRGTPYRGREIRWVAA